MPIPRAGAFGVALGLFVCLTGGIAAAQPAPRPVYVISDLHLNVGVSPGGPWNALEDFRWPRALDGFLQAIATKHPDGVDLVVAGDLLELWQHPTVPCARRRGSECGCSVAEMKEIVRTVIEGHRPEFESLGRFLGDARHRVFVTPGNHDAALMNDEIWALVHQAVPAGRERMLRVDGGTWFSPDGLIAVEHGHQQTFDVNAFPDWPRSVMKTCGTEARFFRPWGENFVQTLYNDVEAQLALIDNLVPDSAGTALYSRYRRLQGHVRRDIARFLVFNVLQTSFYQKVQGLDLGGDKASLGDKDVERCRRCLREDLVLMTLPDAEALLRAQEAPEAGGSAPGPSLRAALRDQVQDLDRDSARALCEQAVSISQGSLSMARDDDETCAGTLGTVANRVFDPDGALMLRDRVGRLYAEKPGLAVYVFGHTHEARLRMAVEMLDRTTIAAYNSGAFQRLMNREALLARKRADETEVAALGRLTHDQLAACYTTVEIVYAGAVPKAEVRQWSMGESPPDAGQFLEACDARCSAPPGNCRRQ